MRLHKLVWETRFESVQAKKQKSMGLSKRRIKREKHLDVNQTTCLRIVKYSLYKTDYIHVITLEI